MQSVFSYFMTHTGNPVIAMPTGTGKSLVIADLAQKVLQTYPNQRVQIVTHVKTLIQQNLNKLLEQWPSAPAGVHSAGLKRRDFKHPILFGGIQSMHRYAKHFGHVDLLFIDECHLVPSKGETMYQRYIKALRKINPLMKIVGLSATPYRLKGGHLVDGGTFTHVCYDNTRLNDFNKLIQEGYLALLVPKQPKVQIDDTGLHTRAGEFIPAEVEARVGEQITEQALREAVEEGHDRQHWLVFAVSVDHVEMCTRILNKLGVRAVAYHSKMPGKEADQALEDFAAGRYRAIVSRDKLTTGVDLPQADMIVMLRLTRSPGLWVQMLGRGTRPALGKRNCLVLDYAGNTRRLGPINDPMLPTKKGPGSGGSAPVKVCPQCCTYQPAGVRWCGYCGYEFPRFMQLAPSASTQALVKAQTEPPKMMKVDHITYKRHQKKGKPDSLCVTYFCGLTRVQEFVCPEHGDYATEKAKHWWHQRSRLEYPGTVNGMLAALNHLPTPSQILVDTNGKYAQVQRAVFN